MAINLNIEHLDHELERPHKKLKVGQVARAPTGTDIASRQSSWINREKDSLDHETWRLATMYRGATCKSLRYTDNQIRQMTPFNGFAHFTPRKEWKAWNTWPGISIAADDGSDELCKKNCLERNVKTCVVVARPSALGRPLLRGSP